MVNQRRKLISTSVEKKSVNQEAIEIFGNYYRYSSKNEILFDWGMPLVLSLFLYLIVAIFVKNNSTLISILVDVNAASLNVMAILAGFNTASMAVIASTNRDTLKILVNARGIDEEDVVGDEDKNILKQILTFFSYAIIIQLALLIIGSLFVLVNKNAQPLYGSIGIINPNMARFIVSFLGFIWFSVILHSLFVSLRNVSLLYRYILFLGKKS